MREKDHRGSGIRGKRPSAAMAVSIVALVFALTGTGLAGVTALSSKAKKQAQGIADVEVNRLAPSLSVKSAASSGKASTADKAGSADTANNAANAEQLGGRGPSSYLPSSSVKRVDTVITQAWNSPETAPVLSMGPLTVTMGCSWTTSPAPGYPPTQTLTVDASSNAADASAGYGLSGSSAPNAAGGATNLSATPTRVITRGGFDSDAGGGELVYRDRDTTITMTFRYVLSSGAASCQMLGTAVEA